MFQISVFKIKNDQNDKTPRKATRDYTSWVMGNQNDTASNNKNTNIIIITPTLPFPNICGTKILATKTT